MSVKFRKMMAKMKQKLGFTLVEMLVVIAIIAILVSIIFPIVNRATVKANAATNAANLRAIEGKLSTMRVMYPQAFEDAVDLYGARLADVFVELGLNQGAADRFVEILKRYGGDAANDFINGGSAVGNYLNYHIYHHTADENGTIYVPVNPPIELYDVPASKEVDVEGLYIPEGVPMTVFISDHLIMATYEYAGNSYTKEDFAYVAENGTFEGMTASGGLTGEEVGCGIGNHNIPEGECACINAGCTYIKHSDDHEKDEQASCTRCGTALYNHSESGLVADRDGKCDICGYGCLHRYSGGTICTYCGYDSATGQIHQHEFSGDSDCSCNNQNCKYSRCYHELKEGGWLPDYTCARCGVNAFSIFNPGCPNCEFVP